MIKTVTKCISNAFVIPLSLLVIEFVKIITVTNNELVTVKTITKCISNAFVIPLLTVSNRICNGYKF